MKIAGTVEAGANLVSGSSRYEILSQEQTENDITYMYYYIEKDVIISSEIEVTSVNDIDKIYQSEISNTDNINIYGRGIFTTEITISYNVSSDEEDADKYQNLSRDFTIKTDKNNLATIPKGTSMVLVYNGNYYTYYVDTDTTIVSLSNFKDNTGIAFKEVTDLTTAEGVVVEENQTTSLNNYSYSETYRLILDFTNSTDQITAGRYYTVIQINDDGVWLEEEQSEVASNVVQVQNREYSYTYELSQNKYEKNDIVEINGTLNLSATTNEMEQSSKSLYAKVQLLNTNGEIINIPIGAEITINGETTQQIGQSVNKLLIENLSNEAISTNLNISIDMENVLEENSLNIGTYTVNVEFILAENDIMQNIAQGEENIQVELFEYENTDFGIRSEINTTQNKNIQLITSGVEETRVITLNVYSEDISNLYVKISKLEKTDSFTYTETENSKTIITKISDTQTDTISSLSEMQDINITFDSSISSGTYRIYFELYDEYGTKISEDFVGFIVK